MFAKFAHALCLIVAFAVVAASAAALEEKRDCEYLSAAYAFRV